MVINTHFNRNINLITLQALSVSDEFGEPKLVQHLFKKAFGRLSEKGTENLRFVVVAHQGLGRLLEKDQSSGPARIFHGTNYH